MKISKIIERRLMKAKKLQKLYDTGVLTSDAYDKIAKSIVQQNINKLSTIKVIDNQYKERIDMFINKEIEIKKAI